MSAKRQTTPPPADLREAARRLRLSSEVAFRGDEAPETQLAARMERVATWLEQVAAFSPPEGRGA